MITNKREQKMAKVSVCIVGKKPFCKMDSVQVHVHQIVKEAINLLDWQSFQESTRAGSFMILDIFWSSRRFSWSTSACLSSSSCPMKTGHFWGNQINLLFNQYRRYRIFRVSIVKYTILKHRKCYIVRKISTYIYIYIYIP